MRSLRCRLLQHLAVAIENVLAGRTVFPCRRVEQIKPRFAAGEFCAKQREALPAHLARGTLEPLSQTPERLGSEIGALELDDVVRAIRNYQCARGPCVGNRA